MTAVSIHSSTYECCDNPARSRGPPTAFSLDNYFFYILFHVRDANELVAGTLDISPFFIYPVLTGQQPSRNLNSSGDLPQILLRRAHMTKSKPIVLAHFGLYLRMKNRINEIGVPYLARLVSTTLKISIPSDNPHQTGAFSFFPRELLILNPGSPFPGGYCCCPHVQKDFCIYQILTVHAPAETRHKALQIPKCANQLQTYRIPTFSKHTMHSSRL